jgi:hypothetical protein
VVGALVDTAVGELIGGVVAASGFAAGATVALGAAGGGLVGEGGAEAGAGVATFGADFITAGCAGTDVGDGGFAAERVGGGAGDAFETGGLLSFGVTLG